MWRPVYRSAKAVTLREEVKAMRFDRLEWPVVNAVLDGNGSSSL
jgi:hypothetical protein